MKLRSFLSLLATAGILAIAPQAWAAPAPHVSISGFDALSQPLPKPYDEAADGARAVATARKRALAEHKKLLIDLGGNWCADCRILAGVIALPEVEAFVRSHYVVVTVDIGRYDKNMQVPAGFGINHLDGVPALLIVDPKSGKLLNKDHLFALADARHMTPQALADWLAQWV